MGSIALQNNLTWQNTFFTVLLCLALGACGGGGGGGGSPTPPGGTYTIGVTVSGLASGGALILQNNGADDLVVIRNGVTTFSTPIAANGSYDVTVLSVTEGQICSVDNGTGTGITSNITNVDVVCSTVGLTVSGDVNGLSSGQTLVLENVTNGSTVTVDGDGSIKSFTFSAKIPYNGAFNIQVQTAPANQTCSVTRGEGSSVTTNVNNISVVCSNTAYSVSGTVTGLLDGQQITLYNNGEDAVVVTGNSSFTFSTPVAYGGSYAITVNQQPAVESCTSINATGLVTGPVSNIVFTCSQTTLSVGGGVTGLASGRTLVLENVANGSTVTVIGDGANKSFIFLEKIPYNGAYNVQVQSVQVQSPAIQTCSVTRGVGSSVTSNVSNISVVCSNTTYPISGSVTGLLGGQQFTLTNNGGDALLKNSNTGFTFPTQVAYGGTYNVAVSQPPAFQSCAVANGSGSVTGPISNIAVSCSQTASTVGGNVSGLTSGSVTLLNNGNVADAKIVDTNGTFTFGTPVDSGQGYSVTVGANPPQQVCTVTNGTGVMPTTNVTNVGVTCVAATAKSLYVTNSSNGTVGMFQINGDGSLTFLGAPPYSVSAGTDPSSIAVTPNGKYAYATNAGSADVSMYVINSAGGLNFPGGVYSIVNAGTGPSGIAVTPNGKYVYVTNATSGTVSMYAVNGAGGLNYLPNETSNTVNAGISPFGIAVTPDGKYAYVTNASSSGAVSMYVVNGTGGLNYPGGVPSSVSAGAAPRGIAVTPNGRYAYVTNRGSDTVSMYVVNGTGGLNYPGGVYSSVSTGTSPQGIAVTPNGKYVYVTNTDSNNVSMYVVNSAGGLDYMGTSGTNTIGAGTGPQNIAVTADGRYAYVTNRGSENISMYNINVDGTLARMGETPALAGTGPVGIAIGY